MFCHSNSNDDNKNSVEWSWSLETYLIWVTFNFSDTWSRFATGIKRQSLHSNWRCPKCADERNSRPRRPFKWPRTAITWGQKAGAGTAKIGRSLCSKSAKSLWPSWCINFARFMRFSPPTVTCDAKKSSTNNLYMQSLRLVIIYSLFIFFWAQFKFLFYFLLISVEFFLNRNHIFQKFLLKFLFFKVFTLVPTRQVFFKRINNHEIQRGEGIFTKYFLKKHFCRNWKKIR